MKKLPWRGALYLVVLGYLFLDLQVCHGPLRDAMRNRRDEAVETAREKGWGALVNQEPITPEQLDLAVTRHLHQRGKTAAEIPDKNLVMIRRAVLQSLIEDTLVRQHADGENFEVPAEESAAFITSWKAAFSSPEDLAKRAGAQGLDPASLDAELARIWKRKRWIEHRIERGVDVTDEEAREWFEANRGGEAGKLRPGFFEPKNLHLGQKDERPLTYEEVSAEIIAHLEAQRTEETVKELTEKLRKVANLHIFPENL